MDPIFDMSVDEVTSETWKVLDECMNLFSSTTHEAYVSTLDRAHTDEHPDIKYFQKIKSDNHYQYHKNKCLKNSIDKIHSRMTVIDPYNSQGLLDRLSTYTALNWSVPEFIDFNELKCARNGWTCKSVSYNDNLKNFLTCSVCQKQVIIKFNESSSEGPDYDFEDYDLLNQKLAEHYKYIVEKHGHGVNCSWRNFETPLDGVYYLRPHLDGTIELIIDDYLRILKTLVSNSVLLQENSDCFSESLLKEDDSHKFKEFVRISDAWLLHRHFKNDEENASIKLNNAPKWLYKLAILGWDLHVQSFANDLVLLVICSKCNKRYFLNSTKHPPVDKNKDYIDPTVGIDLSNSKILTPCKYPMTVSPEESFQFGVALEENPIELMQLDAWEEHKSWCRYKACINENSSYYDYLIDTVINSYNNMGSSGEYIAETEFKFNIDTTPLKRKPSIDISEGLERLSKLRKLYLIEE